MAKATTTANKRKPRAAAEPPVQTAPRAGLYAAAASASDFIRHNPFMQLLGLIVAAVGFAVLMMTAWDLREQARDRQDERIMRAWDTIARKTVGNTGKGAALQHLLDAGIDVRGIDLSCAAAGGLDQDGRCRTRPIYADVTLAGDPGNLRPLVAWDLREAELRSWNIANARFESVNLAGAHMNSCRVDNSELWGTMNNLRIMDCTLTRVSFSGEVNAEIYGSNVSGLVSNSFPGDSPDEQKFRFLNSWAWADQPPLRVYWADTENRPPEPLSHAQFGLTYCDPAGARDEGVIYVVALGCRAMTEGASRQKYPDAWKDIGPITAK